MQILTDKNFILYAAQNYDNPQCHSTEEFNDDIRRIKYVKKLLTRYVETGELKERLILNHIVVLSNLFRPEPLCRILLLKMEPQFQMVKPFILGLKVLTPFICNVKSQRNVDTDDIPMDQNIIKKIRYIFNDI